MSTDNEWVKWAGQTVQYNNKTLSGNVESTITMEVEFLNIAEKLYRRMGLHSAVITHRFPERKGVYNVYDLNISTLNNPQIFL